MRLSNVLENGNGSPGSLAVLYLELCARLSLPLQPVALEGGRWVCGQPAGRAVQDRWFALADPRRCPPEPGRLCRAVL